MKSSHFGFFGFSISPFSIPSASISQHLPSLAALATLTLQERLLVRRRFAEAQGCRLSIIPDEKGLPFLTRPDRIASRDIPGLEVSYTSLAKDAPISRPSRNHTHSFKHPNDHEYPSTEQRPQLLPFKLCFTSQLSWFMNLSLRIGIGQIEAQHGRDTKECEAIDSKPREEHIAMPDICCIVT